MLVNPVDRHGMTAWHIIDFSLSDDIVHPFSKAREFADALDGKGVPSLVEVAEGGKGYYHLWILHEKPVEAGLVSNILREFGSAVMGYEPVVIPSDEADSYIPLPLQYESLLLQRRVFVNTVGKRIKDQHALLEQAGRAPRRAFDELVQDAASGMQVKGAVQQTPEKKKTPAKNLLEVAAPNQEDVTPPDVKPGIREVVETIDAPPEPIPVAVAEPEQKSAGTPPEKKAPATKQSAVNNLMSVLRFRYGSAHYALPADAVLKVESRSSEDGGQLLAESVLIDGMALPVITPEVFNVNAGGEAPLITTLVVVAEYDTRLVVPASGVDGVIRITLDKTVESDHAQLLGRAVYGDIAIGVLDPLRLRETTSKPEVTSVTGAGKTLDIDHVRYLVFSVSGRSFAIETSVIAEILAGSSIRRIPVARGGEKVVAESGVSYIPVIDLVEHLEMERGPKSPSVRVLVISSGAGRMGLQVDSVDGFLTVDAVDVRSLPPEVGDWFGGAIERADNDTILIIDTVNISQP